MGENKINITSTVLEKGLDGVKSFLGKLIGPPIEEVGLLIADPIRAFRYRNQIKMLSKAEKLISEQNIKTKNISLKNLVPLLEYSSIEEDENLSDMWANLLVSYVDASKSFTSSVFPYILSQISSTEAQALIDFDNSAYSMRMGVNISDSELYNLIRLGLIDIQNRGVSAFNTKLYGLTEFDTHYITSLGKDFLQACINK